MNLRMFFAVAAFPLVGIGSGVAQVAQTVEEVIKLRMVSRLGAILESGGEDAKSCDIDALRKILTTRQDDLLGGIDDSSKFATLEDLCQRIVALPERDKLKEEVFDLFKKSKPVTEEAKNWNEILIKTRGGALGLLTKCILAGYGEDMHARMIDSIVQQDDLARAGVLLDQARRTGKVEVLSRLVTGKIEAAKSEGMKEFLRGFSEAEDANGEG